MSTSPEIVQSCSSCGANIYPEHFQRGLAVRQSGKIFCRHCVEEQSRPPAPVSDEPGTTSDAAPIQLADQPDAGGDRSGKSSLHGYAGFAAAGTNEAIYKKPTYKDAAGVTRVRTFHCKLSEGAVYHLDQQVNSWLDAHPDVEIKFASTTVGTWEGKHPEPNLIMTIFY